MIINTTSNDGYFYRYFFPSILEGIKDLSNLFIIDKFYYKLMSVLN